MHQITTNLPQILVRVFDFRSGSVWDNIMISHSPKICRDFVNKINVAGKLIVATTPHAARARRPAEKWILFIPNCWYLQCGLQRPTYMDHGMAGIALDFIPSNMQARTQTERSLISMSNTLSAATSEIREPAHNIICMMVRSRWFSPCQTARTKASCSFRLSQWWGHCVTSRM